MKYSNHVCLTCKKEFLGRLNQKYCSIACKTLYSNKKAAKLRHELIDHKILQKNFLILKEFYADSDKNTPIDISSLYKKGFEFEAPTRKIITKKYGYTYYLINGYAFRLLTERNNQYVIIKK